MNILDFIDSEYVRSYNTETSFNSAQKAKIVCLSSENSITEKIAALTAIADSVHKDTDFYKCINQTIENWKNALEKRSDNTNAIFTANFYESGEEILEREEVFSDYSLANEYIAERKEEYSDDVPTYAVIKRRILNSDDYIQYAFNNEMNMFDISGAFINLENYFEEIPLPFKNGDIVTGFNPFEGEYFGVFSYSDSGTRLDTYDYRYNEFNSIKNPVGTELEKYGDIELYKELRILKLVSKIRKGEMDFFSMLHDFSTDTLDDYL